MRDILSKYDPARVRQWYADVATSVESESRMKGIAHPLSPRLLRGWINADLLGHGTPSRWQAPLHLKALPQVTEVLAKNRAIFLSEKARKDGTTGGLKPWLIREDGTHNTGFTIQKQLRYKSLCEVGSNTIAIGYIQKFGSPDEQDILYALRGFQLKSKVQLTATKQSDGKFLVKFLDWKVEVTDYYDFKADEYITVPNPDFGLKATDLFTPIAPDRRSFVAAHQNTVRLQNAGLARPYSVRIGPWDVTDTALRKSAIIPVK
jgi:hypothetical protein